MRFFLNVALPPLVVFLINEFFFVTGLYAKLWWGDEVLHFAGGIVIAWVVVYFKNQTHTVEPKWLRILSIVGITMIAATVWEWHEFLRDVFIYHRHLLQPSEMDTMKDLFNGMLGATTIALLKRNR